MESGWEIKRYSDGCKDEWDDFVRDSRNGTFLFMRGYMDYHADRFADFSLMAYRDGRLHALLPAHCTATEFCSHRGLTYGGVVTDEKMTVALMLELFWEIFRYLRTYTSVGKWIYSPVPYIYARYPSEEDLYALYRFGARLSGRKVSTVVPSATAWGFSTLRRRKVKHAVREGLSISRDERNHVVASPVSTTDIAVQGLSCGGAYGGRLRVVRDGKGGSCTIYRFHSRRKGVRSRRFVVSPFDSRGIQGCSLL